MALFFHCYSELWVRPHKAHSCRPGITVIGIVKLADHQQSSPGALCLAVLNGTHNMYLHHLVDALHLLLPKACWCTWWAEVCETRETVFGQHCSCFSSVPLVGMSRMTVLLTGLRLLGPIERAGKFQQLP